MWAITVRLCPGPLAGTWLRAPLALTVTLPWAGSLTFAAVRVSLLSASVSLARTPGAALARVVFLGVLYASLTATGATLPPPGETKPGTPSEHRRGGELAVLVRGDLGRRAHDVPDPGLVDDALEEAGGRAGGGHGRAEGGVLDARRLGGEGADGEGLVEDPVEIQVPAARAIGRGDMVPDVAADHGVAGDRVVRPGGRWPFEPGGPRYGFPTQYRASSRPTMPGCRYVSRNPCRVR